MRLTMVVAAMLGVGPTVHAAGTSYLELVPQASGPYRPGATVDVDIVFHNLEGQDIDLLLLQVDVALSDPALSIADFGIVPCQNCLTQQFYASFPTDFAGGNTIANATYSFGTPTPGFITSIEDSGSSALGKVTVTLPDASGTYTLDMLNAEAPDNNFGARFDYGFPDRIILHALTGTLAGGTVDLQVVPEPATLVLLGLGGAVGLYRRRGNQRRTCRHGSEGARHPCE